VAKKCTPLCPHFKCTKQALVYRVEGGRKIAFCRWAGDLCKGYKCNFAICERHSLLPDGTCGLTIRVKRSRSIEEEAKILEEEYSAIRDKLKKLGLEKIE